ncbi:FtsW/RodA/SpoVE family cell cycle protein [Streptomyces sp. NPDC055709]
MDGRLPSGLAGFAAGVAFLAFLPHLAVRYLASRADPLILPLATLLTGLSLVLLHRLDLTYAARPEMKIGQAASGQLVWTVVGVAVFIDVLILLRDHRHLQPYICLTMAIALVLLMAPAFFGAKRWILIGPLSAQPGGFVKLRSRCSSRAI